MNRVLIITYYWPPSGGSGVQRWLKFAKYLPQYGWEPVIYTPENPEANAEDRALLKDISPSLEILKTNITEPYGFYKVLSGNKKKQQTSGSGKKETGEHDREPEPKNSRIPANLISGNRRGSVFHRISLFIRGNFFIPDPRCWWIGPSVKYLKKYLQKHPVDVIVSTGPPHSMHLIARKLHRETGIAWMADFRDPWTEIFYFKHLKLSQYAFRKHRTLEQSVLEEADKIVVVSGKMQKDFQKRTHTPVEIITNGFDPADFSGPQPECAAESAVRPGPESPLPESASGTGAKFRLVHTGLFTENGNPDHLWEALGEKAAAEPDFKKALEIITMGQTDPQIAGQIARAGLNDNFSDLGYVPHHTAVQWQKRASLLLLPLRKEPEAAAILTGKFFEYLASGSPILAFGPAGGDLAEALRDTESGAIYEFADKNGIRGAVDRAYEEFKNDHGGKTKKTLKKEILTLHTDIALPDNPSGPGPDRPEEIPPEKNKYLSGKRAAGAQQYSRIRLTEKLSGILNELIRKK